MIDNDKLLAAIDNGRENAYGADQQSDLSRRRAKAIEYYLGLNTNPAPEGRSQVVDRSVYETIAVKLPSLVRIFAGSSSEVCKCVAIGPDDEQAADQQTAVLNHIVTQQNQWEQIAADWIHDALLMSNGYAMAYWDESKRKIRETYEGQSDDQLAAIVADKDVTIIQHSQEVDEDATAEAQDQYQRDLQAYQQMSLMAQQSGQMLPPPPQDPGQIMSHDLVIEREENEGKVCIQVLPPEHCYVSVDTPNWTLRDCPYFEFRQQKTIADLRLMGLDVPLDVSDEDDVTAEDNARDRFGELRDENIQNAMRRVWARMIWVYADAEGDEQSRLYYVIAVGRTILFSQPVGRIPVASMTAQPLPHRHIGLSEAETVFDIQEIKTAVKRGGLDNLYLANNGRSAISSKVNLADMLDSRPGGVIRMLDDSLPTEGHIMPVVHPFAFDSIIGSLEYFDQDRQNRSGASRYFSGTDAGAINKTASGTMALQNMASMRIEHQARMMAPAVEDLFNAVQEIISKHENKEMTIKLTDGQWVTVDPQAWRTKRDIRISVGVGAGNKESMLQQLNQTLAIQVQAAPFGLAGPEQIHATVTEMSKLAGFANPDKFWLDPAKQPPQPPAPPPPEILKLQADQQKTQATLQQDAAKAQMDHEFRMAQLQFQASEKEKDRLLSLEQTRLQEATKLAIAEMSRQDQQEMMMKNQAFEAAKIDFTAQREDMMKSQTQDENLSQLMQTVQQAMKDFEDRMNGRATVGAQKIRDKNGKVIAARITQADGTTRDVQIQ